MRKLSIKAKVTLWYTSLIVLLMLVMLTFLFTVSEQQILSNAKADLEAAVHEMAGKVEIDAPDQEDREELEDLEDQDDQEARGGLKIQWEDDFATYQNGAVLLLLTDTTILQGKYPNSFPMDFPLAEGGIETIEQGKIRWLVYDEEVGSGVYVRGVYEFSEISGSMNTMILIALILFPFLAVLAAAGGYFITRQAFRPIAKITGTAAGIGKGSDLTQRIALPDAGDEVSAMANTFDSMLDRLEASFEAEKQFTSDVSHELRTPLAILKTQSEYAQKLSDKPELKEFQALKELQELLAGMQEQTDLMTRLISQLLELSRTEQQQSLQMEEIDLSELLTAVGEQMEELATQKSIQLRIVTEPNVITKCEQTLMMRLLLNLISNALKYTEPGGWVEARLEKTVEGIRLTVEDNGIGISKADQEKIFRRFYQADPSRSKDPDSGFGLGLALCKWIVAAHHGTIQVESELGKGSRFIVEI